MIDHEKFTASKRAERDRGTPPHYQIHKTARQLSAGPALSPLPRPSFGEALKLLAAKLRRKLTPALRGPQS